MSREPAYQQHGFPNRRSFVAISAATIAGTVVPDVQTALAAPKLTGVTFSFGTYGMKTMKLEAAIRTVAKIGYDGIEIAAVPDWDSAPQKMSTVRRTKTRTLLSDLGLAVTALMEHLAPSADEQEHARQLDRLKRVAALGHDLSPGNPPLIQTVLGGGSWNDKQSLFLDRLGDWAKLGKQLETVIAIKPHRGGALSKPSEAVWLIKQLKDTPWLRMVYDYSHYAFRGMPLAETIKTALPYTAHIAIKDTVKTETGFRFVLPGESGGFDYPTLLKMFYAGGYRGDVCCEVSSMVWNKRGYDPLAAAKSCYANISPIFGQVDVPRRS